MRGKRSRRCGLAFLRRKRLGPGRAARSKIAAPGSSAVRPITLVDIKCPQSPWLSTSVLELRSQDHPYMISVMHRTLDPLSGNEPRAVQGTRSCRGCMVMPLSIHCSTDVPPLFTTRTVPVQRRRLLALHMIAWNAGCGTTKAHQLWGLTSLQVFLQVG